MLATTKNQVFALLAMAGLVCCLTPSIATLSNGT